MALRFLLRRLLLAIPTTLAIVVVLFGLVNLVPLGEPSSESDASGSANATGSGDAQRAARRAFRDHYALDRPVFLNLRFRTSTDSIAEELESALAAEPTARRRAEESIVELGRFAATPLLAIASDATREPALRDLALGLLPDCTRQVVRLRDAVETRDAKTADNRTIDSLAAQASLLRDGVPALGAEVRDRLVASWSEFVSARPRRFHPEGIVEKTAIAITETRFGAYLGNLAHLDFGTSLADRQPVLPVFRDRLARTSVLGFGYILVSFAAAIPLALVSVRLRRDGARRGLNTLLFALYSLPGFFVAILVQRWFAAGRPFEWFPVGGFRSATSGANGSFAGWLDVAHHLCLPVFVASVPAIVVLTRLLQGSLEEALSSEYVLAARAKGLDARAVLFQHALRNALLPLVTAFGAMVPIVISGAATIEFLFEIPGVGLYLLDAVVGGDFNVILAVTLFAALATQIGFLIADVLYGFVDPRIRTGARESRA